ncbi:hypothetical protein FLONG3_1342 [Fusarium longipes]|uniref:Uncharacterized protein n=1 Tax=Fusarium longipes TaxID=694270 RepID=A0A395T718_9HYPO|nr:hypothetical protein FLONG3_1342 [Fusarium longipes]
MKLAEAQRQWEEDNERRREELAAAAEERPREHEQFVAAARAHFTAATQALAEAEARIAQTDEKAPLAARELADAAAQTEEQIPPAAAIQELTAAQELATVHDEDRDSDCTV